MPRFVTAVYGDAETAHKAIEALKKAGFSGPDIQEIDKEREAQGFFDRLFLDKNGGHEESDGLKVMGIGKDDVDAYAREIQSGASLVIVMCDKERMGRARQILDDYEAIELEDRPSSDQDVEGERSARDRMPETPRGAPVAGGMPPKWFRVVDIEEPDLGQGVRSHSVHIRPSSNIRHIASGKMPGARRAQTFEQREDEFRLHYAENFADSDYDFDDFRLGYLYGMSLAQNKGLAEQKWEDIKEHAGRGWREHSPRPWSLFEEAVCFGWRVIRRQQRNRQKEERRP